MTSRNVSLVTGQAFAPEPVSRSQGDQCCSACRRGHKGLGDFGCGLNYGCRCHDGHPVTRVVVRTPAEIVAEWDAMTNGGMA